MGFVPFQNPELTILISLDEPWPKTYGGTVAAPAFREIAEQVLPMLNVPPVPGADQPLPKDVAFGPGRNRIGGRFGGKPLPTRVSVKLNPVTMNAVAELAREIRQAEPQPSMAPAVATTQDKSPESGPAVMPDLSGMSMRHVVDLMSEFDVNFKFSGSRAGRLAAAFPGEQTGSRTGLSGPVRASGNDLGRTDHGLAGRHP